MKGMGGLLTVDHALPLVSLNWLMLGAVGLDQTAFTSTLPIRVGFSKAYFGSDHTICPAFCLFCYETVCYVPTRHLPT